MPPNGNQKRLLFWFYLVILFFLITQGSLTGTYRTTETNWSDLENKMLAKEDVAEMIVVNKERVEITLKSEPLAAGKYPDFRSSSRGPHYFLTIGSVEAFESRLLTIQEKHELAQLPEVKYVTRTNWLRSIFSWLLPFFIIIAIWYYIFGRIGRRGGMGGMNPFDFGKSKATLFDTANQSQHSFDDVAGLEEAKLEIQEIVAFLKDPDRYTYLGAKIPKGVILVGPPGTGKTLLAKAVAGEAQVPFFHLSGSEFVEMFVGVGASRVRDLFRKAKDKSPSIIFIDELDAIGRARGNSLSMRANDERESTLNQLLTEMDGFGTNTGVIVMAATNRADILDKALLRPGRFDRHIYLELPNLEERKAIFGVHVKPLRLAKDIDVELLAGQTPGFSGADIANICNEAALIAARQRKEAIDMKDFSSATDRIIAGLEKKSKIISEEEKRIIAFHEAGHATVSWFLEHGDELMKVSIVPRGKSLGSAWYLPEEHQLYTKGQLTDKLCMALGGRAAEELIFGEISSGALDDLEKVTKQAYSMVAFYGLDEKLGHISFYDSTGQSDQSLHRPYSEATAQLIDEEVRKLVDQAYKESITILKRHRAKLEALAALLLDQEVATRDDLVEIFGERGSVQKPQAALTNG
ncbi:MAG: ATP-dependent zinc metalloprotease FtsH [Saprospiraceae bacterium]|nr:ATP-dependent zinc metalloprotease FtsH [Saprospiraceae bacterium]